MPYMQVYSIQLKIYGLCLNVDLQLMTLLLKILMSFGPEFKEWSLIPHEMIQKLVESMPKRIKGVIKNKGLWTKY